MKDDLISRKQAIDALEKGKDITAKGEVGGFYNAIIQHDIDKIEQLPSAEKTGRWIIEPGIGRKCDQCEFDIGNDLDWMEYVNYCPNCGSYNGGGV